MAASKTFSVVAALVLMTLLSTGVASAQPVPLGVITCQTFGDPTTVRAESMADQLGDITALCTNNPPASGGLFTGTVKTNVTVSTNVSITNNRDFSKVGGGNTLDNVLIINENNCTDPIADGDVNGNGILPNACPDPIPDIRFQDPQFGELAGQFRVSWNGISFPVPGGLAQSAIDDLVPDTFATPDALAAAVLCPAFDFPFFTAGSDLNGDGLPDCNPDVTTIRITAIRGNISELGVTTPGFGVGQVTAVLTITGPTTLPLTNNVLNVAVPFLGLVADVDEDDAGSGLQCEEDDSAHLTFKITEGFPTAFKTLGLPSFTPGKTQVEAAYFAPGSRAGGGASQPTRFLLRFFNIPEGVRIGVHLNPDCTAKADLKALGEVFKKDDDDLLKLTALVCNEVGDKCTAKATTLDKDDVEDIFGKKPDEEPFTESPVKTDDIVEVKTSQGFGSIVYSVDDADPFVNEDCHIPVWFGWKADTKNDLPAPGIGQLAVTFAPLSTQGTSKKEKDDVPVPRFIDTGGNPTNVIQIRRCTTTILFPFVTNRSGFDTGLVISNTSEDWLGTNPQNGTCTIHYHGTTGGNGASPPDDTSKVIDAGTQLIWLLSSGNIDYEIDATPEFQGYVIAVCEFQFAHGYAFLSDGFGSVPTLSQGYLALIIETKTDGKRATPGLGGEETLGN